MSIKKNTIANYAGQGYATLIGIFMLPFYLNYLGAEAYGLVGFFTVMQSWLMLLDAGLTPTLARQMALKRGSDESGIVELRKLLRSMEVVFLGLSIATCLGIWLGSDWIAVKWLTVKTLSHSDVAYCVTLMGLMVGIHWFTSLYRSGLQGLEMMVWLNAVTIFFVTLRFVVVYIMLRWLTQDPRHFFEYQLIISLLEFLVVSIKLYKSIPTSNLYAIGPSWGALRAVMPFASGIAYTSTLWVILTQVDKLILSHVLSLKEYGYFALVAVVSNGLLNLTTPITQAIIPRMSVLLSSGNEEAMISLYRKATQVVVAIIFPIAGVLALFSEMVLYAWSGDRAAAVWAGPVLAWFVLGNGVLAVAAFQYYLQFAHGKLKLHVINSTINSVVQVPVIVYAAINYGALGAAYAWFATRMIAFFIFPAIVHSHFAPGIHVKWLVNDIGPGLLTTIVCLLISYYPVMQMGDADRLATAFSIVLVTMICVSANFVASSIGRSQFVLLWQKITL